MSVAEMEMRVTRLACQSAVWQHAGVGDDEGWQIAGKHQSYERLPLRPSASCIESGDLQATLPLSPSCCR